eukprot:RCo003227
MRWWFGRIPLRSPREAPRRSPLIRILAFFFFSGVFSGVVFAEIVVSSLLHRDSEMLLRTYVSFCAKASVSDSGGCGFSPFILLVGTRRRLLQSSYPRITVRNRSELWF